MQMWGNTVRTNHDHCSYLVDLYELPHSHFGETNTIQLPDLLEGVTFDFKHGFLQMQENNLLSGVAYEDHMPHLRKFIKLTNTVRQNHVPADYVRLYAFPFSLNEKA
ncbi:hypothetical protein HKD37_02G004883 [Glycine soja]